MKGSELTIDRFYVEACLEVDEIAPGAPAISPYTRAEWDAMNAPRYRVPNDRGGLFAPRLVCFEPRANMVLMDWIKK
jgi:hypothetical protein